jgi:hypothetical protein
MITVSPTDTFSAEAQYAAHYQGDDHSGNATCPQDSPCLCPVEQPIPYNSVTNNGVRNYGLHFVMQRPHIDYQMVVHYAILTLKQAHTITVLPGSQ